MIVTAFAEGDRKALKQLLSREVYDGFVSAIGQREARQETIEFKFVGIDKAEITDAALKSGTAQVTVRFLSKLISATHDKTGKVIDGDPVHVGDVTDIWTFARDVDLARSELEAGRDRIGRVSAAGRRRGSRPAMIEAPPAAPGSTPLDFDDLPGWDDDDHAAAFRRFPPRRRGPRRSSAEDAAASASMRRRSPAHPGAGRRAARRSRRRRRRAAFFEAEFAPHRGRARLRAAASSPATTSRSSPARARRRARFAVPLYRAPDDLVEFDPGRPAARHRSGSPLRPADGRRASRPIPTAARSRPACLAGRGLELVWLADPVDAFFIHIQGAARIRLAEGGDDARHLCGQDRPSLHADRPGARSRWARSTKGNATMQAIRAWLAAHPDEAPARDGAEPLLHLLPRGAGRRSRARAGRRGQGAADAGRSLAVDRLLHSFHAPVLVETTLAGRAGIPPADWSPRTPARRSSGRRAATSSSARAMTAGAIAGAMRPPAASSSSCRAAAPADEPAGKRRGRLRRRTPRSGRPCRQTRRAARAGGRTAATRRRSAGRRADEPPAQARKPPAAAKPRLADDHRRRPPPALVAARPADARRACRAARSRSTRGSTCTA